MTHARNKYKTKLIFHVNRNGSLLEPAAQINFNGGEKMESNSWVGNAIMTIDSNTHQHNDFIEMYNENEMKKSEKKGGKKAIMTVSCTVCSVSGRIKTKKRDLQSSTDLGEITRCRRCPKEFVDLECKPARIAALLEKNDLCNTE